MCKECDENLGREKKMLNDPLGECNCTANIPFKENGKTHYLGLAKENEKKC